MNLPVTEAVAARPGSGPGLSSGAVPRRRWPRLPGRRAESPTQIFTDFKSEHVLLASLISELGDGGGGSIRVLEAGCGQKWPLDVRGTSVHITGVDTDAEAMRIRREDRGDLDEAIVGDLRSVELPAGAFDVAYCSFVLEHVEGAALVLDRLRAATRPGGRIVIRVPDRDSVFGFFVRYTPHRLHVLYKKYVERFPDAGKPGHAPYPTVYDEVISLRGLREYAAANNLRIVSEYGSCAYLKVFGPLRSVVGVVLNVISLLAGRRIVATHNNVGMVFEVPADDRST